MLVRDPSARATATDVLQHDWVKENGVAGDVLIEPEVCPQVHPVLVRTATAAALWGSASHMHQPVHRD
jgi:hypothetical protein